MTNQEISRGTIVQKADLPKTGSNNRKFIIHSKERAWKPSEKKHEMVLAYAVTTTTIETTTPMQYT